MSSLKLDPSKDHHHYQQKHTDLLGQYIFDEGGEYSEWNKNCVLRSSLTKTPAGTIYFIGDN